jgi:hypothetical protein
MDFALRILQAIDGSALADGIRDSGWMFPAFETVHVVAIVFVVGSIARLDLRLMGLVWRDRPVSEVSGEMLPYTWIAFAAATVFGILLWLTRPLEYFEIAFFDVKLILITLAGINMLYFQRVTFRTVGEWDREPLPPPPARIAGAVSMALWVGVVICGRFIGFV